MQPHELKDVIALIRKEASNLIQYLETLGDDDWEKQSACEDWTVAEVVGHMIFVFKDVCYDGVSRGLTGDISPPEGFPDPENLIDATRHRIISDIAKRHTRELGSELLTMLESHAEAVCKLWDTLTPANWDTQCYRMAGIRPAHTFISTPITETAMHHWDIRSRISPRSAYLSSESMHYFMQSISQGNYFNRGEVLAATLRYRFNLGKTEPYTLDFIITGDSVSTELNSNAAPHDTFYCDEETLALLLYGRLSAGQAIKLGKISWEGKIESFMEFNRWYHGG